MLSPAFRRSLVALLLTLSPLVAQVTLKRGAVVYQGSATNTTAPATIDETKLKEATPEWQKIQADGIDPDSAQGKQLLNKMNERIKDAVKSVANSESRDLVTRKDDILDKKGKDVVDLTDKVVDKINE